MAGGLTTSVSGTLHKESLPYSALWINLHTLLKVEEKAVSSSETATASRRSLECRVGLGIIMKSQQGQWLTTLAPTD